MLVNDFMEGLPQPAVTWLKLTTETLEEGVKYVQSFTPYSSVSIANFEYVIAGWVRPMSSLVSWLSNIRTEHGLTENHRF